MLTLSVFFAIAGIFKKIISVGSQNPSLTLLGPTVIMENDFNDGQCAPDAAIHDKVLRGTNLFGRIPKSGC